MTFKILPTLLIFKHYERFLHFSKALENTYFTILKVIYSHHLESFIFNLSWMKICWTKKNPYNKFLCVSNEDLNEF